LLKPVLSGVDIARMQVQPAPPGLGLDAPPGWRPGPDAKVAALLVSAAALVGLWWLFGDPATAPTRPPDLQSSARVDGTLSVVEAHRLVLKPLRPVGGRPTLSFVIRSRDSRHFDLAHLRSHSALGVPTRIYYRKAGARLLAVFKEDAPANSARGRPSG